VTVVPEGLQGLAPFCAQVDPHLLTLTERWVTGGTAGEVPVGELLRQVLVDDPQASLRLMYVTSQLDVATVVSPTFYRPRAYQARYRLTVRVESPAIGVKQSWLHAVGESRNLVSAARATNDAITQAVREFYGQLAAVQNVRAAFGKLRFKTAYEQQLWEECSRLMTDSIIYDNATILSQLVAYKAHQGDQHSAALLTQVSPIAWQHMNLCGRYEFTGEPEAIHMPAIIQALVQVPVTQDCALYTLDYTFLEGWAKIPMWCSHMAFDLHSGRSGRFRGYVSRRCNHFPPAGFVALDTVLNHG
jgi:Tn3 transposase DDE domain